MKILRAIIVFLCSLAIGFGTVYNIFIMPFSSPIFDLISWMLIGFSYLLLYVIDGGSKK